MVKSQLWYTKMTRIKHPLELKLEENHNNGARKAFFDMDGFQVDFDGGRRASGHPADVFKLTPGAYRRLQPYPGLIDFLTKVIYLGWDVWNATKIPTDNPYAAAEKLFWIEEHTPWMIASTIITPNKGCLGDETSVLVDDRPHKAMCSEFKGSLLTYGFDNEYKSFDDLLERFFRVEPAIVPSFDSVHEAMLQQYTRKFDPTSEVVFYD